MWELSHALAACKDTAPGPDNLHNQMFRHLSENAKGYMLSMFNRIWEEGVFPSGWREAIVIGIPKPGKDRTLPSNYRPISLTSCLCKLLERMINRKLMWLLESQRLLSPVQCGFRRFRSTLDHLTTLEGAIQDAFVSGQHLLGIFFDLEKAYDTTWRYGILRTIYNWGIRGRLPIFLTNFLSNRTFRVRIGTTLSMPRPQENGVPQGSVLSVTLFAIAINDIVSCIPQQVTASLYVDDLAIFCRSSSTAIAARNLQGTVNNVLKWATDHGFKFSLSKTTCVHFCRISRLHIDPDIYLGGTVIPYSETVKFLGLIFDKTLTWRPHFAALRARCVSPLNLLRVLRCKSWGAQRSVMLRLYRALVRSKLDYGSPVYASARPSYIKTLDTVHNQGIRLATGAFRTSPIPSLYAESGEQSLYHRRMQLTLSYVSSLYPQSDHPTYNTIFRQRLPHIYRSHPKATRPLGVRHMELQETLQLRLPQLIGPKLPMIPPWIIPRPAVLFHLSKLSKSVTLPQEYVQQFHSLVSEYSDFVYCYTDGSKSLDQVGCSFVVENHTAIFKLPPFSSVFTAELFAIVKCLLFIGKHLLNNFIVCSDSLSSLQAIDDIYSTHPLVVKIHYLLLHLREIGKNILFCWVPGHVGIRGNVQADTAAKQGACKELTDTREVLVQDFKLHVKHTILSLWMREWEATRNNKLKAVKADVRAWHSSFRSSRREEEVLTRLRIGHCFLTHSFLLKREEPPLCTTCNCVLSVAHILTDCAKYRRIRVRFNLPANLPRILGDEPSVIDRLFGFLQETVLFKLI